MLFDLIRKIVVGEEVTENDLTIVLKEWCNRGDCLNCPISDSNLRETKLFADCSCVLDGEKILAKLNEIGYFKESV